MAMFAVVDDVLAKKNNFIINRQIFPFKQWTFAPISKHQNSNSISSRLVTEKVWVTRKDKAFWKALFKKYCSFKKRREKYAQQKRSPPHHLHRCGIFPNFSKERANESTQSSSVRSLVPHGNGTLFVPTNEENGMHVTDKEKGEKKVVNKEAKVCF